MYIVCIYIYKWAPLADKLRSIARPVNRRAVTEPPDVEAARAKLPSGSLTTSQAWSPAEQNSSGNVRCEPLQHGKEILVIFDEPPCIRI